jgi:hypothetical protein
MFQPCGTPAMQGKRGLVVTTGGACIAICAADLVDSFVVEQQWLSIACTGRARALSWSNGQIPRYYKSITKIAKVELIKYSGGRRN